MLAPWVTVHEHNGKLIKVSFFLEHFKKIEYLHRTIKHVKYTGWTEQTNLVSVF